MREGKETTIEQFPYVVSLVNRMQDDSYLCGGSILSPRHILTAAHCVYGTDPNQFTVRAGSSFWDRGGTVHQVAGYSVHEDYRFRDHAHGSDLALVELSDPIKFNGVTKSEIRMFESGEQVAHGENADTAGWGCVNFVGDTPDQLHSLELRIVGKRRCWDIYRGALNQGEVCAEAHEDKVYQSASKGDSGGPLVVKGRLAGVVAHAVSYSITAIHPNVFTEVAYFRKWIDDKIQGVQDELLIHSLVSMWCS